MSATHRRVVFVDHCAQLSGAELALARLIAHLPAGTAHVILGEHGPLEDVLRDAGAQVEVLALGDQLSGLPRDRVRSSTAAFSAGASTVAAVRALRQRLRELRPDLVHTNSMKAHLYGGVAGRLAGVPVLWHVRDRLSNDYLPANAVRMMRAGATVIPSGVIANSAATAATIPSRARTWVVPSPIDIDVPTRRADDARPFTVAMVGRLTEWKGQHVFVDAFADAFTDTNARALIIGAPLFGEHDYETQLREQIARRAMTDRIELLGFRHDVPELLAGCDVLVHASVIPEPFGQVVPQGMAAGLAVVASAAGGPAEVITDGVDGVLVPPGDGRRLAEVLRSLASDPTRCAELGESARITARRYAGADVSEDVSKVYQALLPDHMTQCALGPNGNRSRSKVLPRMDREGPHGWQ